MKYLFVYAYKGKNLGKPENGEGSVEMTLHGSDNITPKVIKSACDIVREDLNGKGIQVDLIVPMGWFKYDEAENEDNKKLLKSGMLEKTIDDIDFAIKTTDSQDDYSMGMRNGMRYVKSLIDGKEPQYEPTRTDEEIKLGIDLGDEVVGDYGSKGVVVGMVTYEGEVLLSLLMINHKVPQLVKASGYKTKTGRHFPQIIEVLEQMKGEADGK